MAQHIKVRRLAAPDGHDEHDPAGPATSPHEIWLGGGREQGRLRRPR